MGDKCGKPNVSVVQSDQSWRVSMTRVRYGCVVCCIQVWCVWVEGLSTVSAVMNSEQNRKTKVKNDIPCQGHD